MNATAPPGRSRLAWASGEARSSHFAGRTSISTRARSGSGESSSDSRGDMGVQISLPVLSRTIARPAGPIVASTGTGPGVPNAMSSGCTGHARHCPQRQGGGLHFGEPKSQAGRRPIALPEPLVALLRSHRKAQAAERLRSGSSWEENDLVFCQPNGRPLDPDGHSKAWKKFLARAGVREARLHDARHTAATLLLVQGVDQRTVMAIMGWSEVSMTKRYQHVVPELRREAASRIREVLWGPAGASDAHDGS